MTLSDDSVLKPSRALRTSKVTIAAPAISLQAAHRRDSPVGYVPRHKDDDYVMLHGLQQQAEELAQRLKRRSAEHSTLSAKGASKKSNKTDTHQTPRQPTADRAQPLEPQAQTRSSASSEAWLHADGSKVSISGMTTPASSVGMSSAKPATAEDLARDITAGIAAARRGMRPPGARRAASASATDTSRQRRSSSSPANPDTRATGKRGATATLDMTRPSPRFA